MVCLVSQSCAWCRLHVVQNHAGSGAVVSYIVDEAFPYAGTSFGRWCSELTSIAAVRVAASAEQAALLVPSMARHGFCRLDRLSAALSSSSLNPGQLVALAQQLQLQPSALCDEFSQAGIASMVVQASVLMLLAVFVMLRPL